MNINHIRFDHDSETPIYQQISNYVRQLIATELLKPGDHLPAVRNLALALGINHNTVLKAYKQLEQEKVVVSRPGTGTVIRKDGDDPAIVANRQRYLSQITGDNIVKALSLGFTPEEIEVQFSLHMTRWREERNAIVEVPQDITEIMKKD